VSHIEHRATSPASVRCAVFTISDTRTEETDAGGRAIVELLTGAGHEIATKAIMRDDPDRIREALAAALAHERVQAVITTGGTGLSSRDGTYEVVSSMLTREIRGFGELFRMLSYQEIGAAAMMSRAVAGTAAGRIVICLPGSPAAVLLAMSKLVLPELGHMVREASR
jgi:molybdopterin adenylyltransferase